VAGQLDEIWYNAGIEEERKKERKVTRFSAIVTGASQGGSPEPMQA